VGEIHPTMSTLRAFEIALESEQKAFDFYHEALAHITNPEIQKLFAELRDEETEHVRLVQQAISALPPEAALEWEDDPDEYPAL
jgi:rubrerythrin